MITLKIPINTNIISFPTLYFIDINQVISPVTIGLNVKLRCQNNFPVLQVGNDLTNNHLLKIS